MRKTNTKVEMNNKPGKAGSPSAEKNLAIVETVGQKMKRAKAVLMLSISHPANMPFEIGSMTVKLYRGVDTSKHLKQA